MRINYLKDNLWKIGLAVAVLFFVNIFIQSRFYLNWIENQSYVSGKVSDKNKLVDLEDRLDKPQAIIVTPSLSFTTPNQPPLWIENLKLLGTIVGNPSLAFICDLISGKCATYKLRGIVSSVGVKIVGIAAHRVILEKDGIRKILALGGKAEYRSQQEGPTITTVSPGKMIVSKSGMLGEIDKANELLAKIRISSVPDALSDKLKGFRIDNIPSGSIIEQAGVKSGDIICSVQGKKIGGTRDAMRILSDIKNQPIIEVALLRSGESVNLRYEFKN